MDFVLTELRKIDTDIEELFHTIRALAIIRLKNPSRGKKRSKDDTKCSTNDNPLAGIIEWVQMDDPIPASTQEIPILYVRGNFPEDNTEGIISWKNITIPLQMNLMECFHMLCKSLSVFNVDCRPSDKQFFVFFKSIFMGVGNIMTTGEKFLRSLE